MTSPSPHEEQAPRRVSKRQTGGVEDNGTTVTVHVGGEAYELNDGQLAEVATRLKKTRPGGIAADQLRAIVERIERMEEEKAAIASDLKDIYAEAKGTGFDVPTLKKILKLRAMDAAERDEAEHLLDTYCVALGMRPQMDLFEDVTDAGASNESAFDRDLYLRAVAIVQRDQKASASYLQRMLQIGYNRAAELLEHMETEGIVGPANHVGKREVLSAG